MHAITKPRSAAALVAVLLGSLAAFLLLLGPAMPAFADDWIPSDPYTVKVNNLADSSAHVTLYKVATTTPNSDNTLTTVWTGTASDGTAVTGTSWQSVAQGIDSSYAGGDISMADYENGASDSTAMESYATTITAFVLSHTNNFSKTSDIGELTANSDGTYTTYVQNLTAGLYVLEVSDAQNSSQVYQNMLVAVNPKDDKDTQARGGTAPCTTPRRWTISWWTSSARRSA